MCRLGRYDILGQLAVGGMAEVYLAREQVSGETLRHVAIKLLTSRHKERAEAQGWLEMFEREGRTSARLLHPNICHVYEFGREGSACFIAMEWVHGVSLRDLMIALRDSRRILPAALAANIGAHAAAGLEHAHTATDAHQEPLRVVHRDVNPTNVMLRHDGVVKVVDFGVAQVAEAKSERDRERIFGKAAYMAPEQMRGEPVDHRADIFALGVTLFELFTGARLYRRASAADVQNAVLHDPLPSLRAMSSQIPEALEAIVLRALAKSPDDRYQSAGALQADLEEYLASTGHVSGARPLAALMRELFGESPSTPPLKCDAEVRAELERVLSVGRSAGTESVDATAHRPPQLAPVLVRTRSRALSVHTLSWAAAAAGLLVAVSAMTGAKGDAPVSSPPSPTHAQPAISAGPEAPSRPLVVETPGERETALVAEPKGETPLDDKPAERKKQSLKSSRSALPFLRDPGF